MIVSVLLG